MLAANAEPFRCPVSASQLQSISVKYWGLDQQPHSGTLLVNQQISVEVKSIFTTLFNAKFPIAKIRPLSYYHNNENQAMADNDTFAYSCRPIIGFNAFPSLHSYGLAIDINPLFNPYINGNVVLPVAGEKYLQRNIIIPGMIIDHDIIVNTFQQYGWRWGGHWHSLKDYQHFEKS